MILYWALLCDPNPHLLPPSRVTPPLSPCCVCYHINIPQWGQLMQGNEQIAVFWVKRCLYFPFLSEHPQIFTWNLTGRSAESTLGKVCLEGLLLWGEQLFILHGMIFFLEAGFRASPSVYDTLSIVLQHLLWKKIVVVWLKQKYKNSQLQKVIWWESVRSNYTEWKLKKSQWNK